MRVLEVARQLGNGMRVLVLTAQAADLETRIACLEAGADDCMMKPFAMRELKARCRVLARRQDGSALLRCGDLQLNRLQQSLECGEEPIALSRREFGLLEYLMMNRGRLRIPRNAPGTRLELERSGEYQRRGRVHQLSAPEARPQRLVDRNRPGPGISHRRHREPPADAWCRTCRLCRLLYSSSRPRTESFPHT